MTFLVMGLIAAGFLIVVAAVPLDETIINPLPGFTSFG
jgi:hypothetical protein